MNHLAQSQTNIGDLRGLGPLGLESNTPGQAPAIFNQIISVTVGLMTVVAALWFIFLVISGGYTWMTAGGDKGAIENARDKIFHGVIGLVIVIVAVFLADLVGRLLGIPNYILNPGQFILDFGG